MVIRFRKGILWILLLGILTVICISLRMNQRIVETMTWMPNPDNHESLVRNHTEVKEESIYDELHRMVPNIPKFYTSGKRKPKGYSPTCAKFPDVVDLHYNNFYWQTYQDSNLTIHMLSAFYDNRTNNAYGASVRVLAVMNSLKKDTVVHCQIWFEGERGPAIVQSTHFHFMWHEVWGNAEEGLFQPYMISCHLPPSLQDKVPVSVSIVEKPCDNATNNIAVIYNKPEQKKDFAVCVKGLDYFHDDVSVRLIEWIEFLHILGADKVFFYDFQVHPNVSRTLAYLQTQGKVEVSPITLPGYFPNVPALRHLFLKKKAVHRRQMEVMPYNDCFYKHMYEYRYIVLLDTDEVIVPTVGTWKELVDILEETDLMDNQKISACYYARNVYFLDQFLPDNFYFDNIPKYMHILQHVYRTENYTKPKYYVKSFLNTEEVLAVHNHFPMYCLSGSCKTVAIDTDYAHLQHYRSDCVIDLKKTCEELKRSKVMDDRVWQYKKELIDVVNRDLKELGYLV